MKTQNQNNKKPNNKQKKEKFQPKSFKKLIIGGIEVVNKFVPEIASELHNIFDIDGIFNTDAINLDELAQDIFDSFSNHIPEMRADGENSYWSLTHASNRIALKTDAGYQFGWIIKYNKDRSDYESVEFFYTAYAAKALPETEDFTTIGWRLEE